MFDSIVSTNNVPYNIISTNGCFENKLQLRFMAMKNKNISVGVLTNFNVPIWSNV